MDIDRKLKLVADGEQKAVSETKGSTDWGSWSIAEEEMFQDLAARVEELEGGAGLGPTAGSSDVQWQMGQLEERMENMEKKTEGVGPEKKSSSQHPQSPPSHQCLRQKPRLQHAHPS